MKFDSGSRSRGTTVAPERRFGRACDAPRRLHFSIIFLLAGVTALAGCLPLSTWRIEPPVPPPPHGSGLPGIASLSHYPVIRVLIVHGMGSHVAGYSDEITQHLAHELAYDVLVDTKPIPIHGAPGDDGQSFYYGQILRRVFTDRERRRLMVFYELLWSPTTEGAKQSYLAYDHTAVLERMRVAVDARIKRRLMDDSLADPILYSGCFRPAMQVPVRRAIEVMFEDDARQAFSAHLISETENRPSPIAVITYSLGSRMLFDTLAKMRAEGSQQQHLAKEWSGECNLVYMLANQLTLLELASLRPPEEADCEPRGIHTDPNDAALLRSLDEFLDLRFESASSLAIEEHEVGREGRSRDPRANPVAFVAVSDPNDLLSYSIPSALVRWDPRRGVSFANVYASIARWVVLGIVVNPMTAHQGYDEDDRVIDLLIHGAGTPESQNDDE